MLRKDVLKMNYVFALLDLNQIEEFTMGMNEAFKARRNWRIPYAPETIKKIIQEYDAGNLFYSLVIDDVMVGGVILKRINDIEFCMKHIWIRTDEQGNGYADLLMCGAEKSLEKLGARYIYLSVANCYKPAVCLYQKHGFKKLGVTANVPKTYYFIDMVKSIPPHRYSEYKRIMKLVISEIKFRLLFDEQSTPRRLHGVLYGKRNFEK